MEKEIKPPSHITSDGRVRRSERSRQVIIDAMLALMHEGNLIPTAQQVADRADIAIRTVFRHFSEMEMLYAQMDESIRDSYENLFINCDRDGSLEERVLHAVELRATAYTKLTKLIVANLSLLWRSPTLRKSYLRNQKHLRKELELWLPELNDLNDEEQEAIDAMASFEFWNRMHDYQGLSRSACIDIIYRLILGYLTPKAAA